MSPSIVSLRKALSLLLVALLFGAPASGVRAEKGGKNNDNNKNSDDNKSWKRKAGDKDDKRTKPKDGSTSATEAGKEKVAKKPRDDRGDSRKGNKSAKRHDKDDKSKKDQRKQVVRKHDRNDRKHVRLPFSPFRSDRFLALQPSFAPPQRAFRSTVPTQAELRRSRTREVIMAVPDSLSDADAAALGAGLTLNLDIQRRLPLLGMKVVRLRVPEGQDITAAFAKVIDQSATDERILGVQPNYVFETAQGAVGAIAKSIPQYATAKVRLVEAHRIALGRGVRIAVIDTGLDSSHPELAGVAIERFDAIGTTGAASEAHGTAVAGIVAARLQIQGVAPDARVLAVRAFATGSGQKPEATTLSIIDGIHWAIANGARVINMSFAGPNDPLLQRAIEAGIAKGIIFVAAAGNGGPSAASAYPAAYDGVIAVTAIDSEDKLYDMANRGDYIALAAPGVDILTTAPNAAYEISSGTSLAAAHVSGIIALMLERRPDLSLGDARAILKRTARNPGQLLASSSFGAGIIDAAGAVAATD